MIFLLLIPTLILGYLLWQAGRRADAASLAFALEREAWGVERRELLNRIQAPETEVYKSFEPTRLKNHVGFDNDAEYWAALEELT